MAKLERDIEEADGATLRRWYEEGRSLREVAALGGVSHPQTVANRIRDAGGTLRPSAATRATPRRPRRQHPRRPSDAELLEMYQTMSSLDIAAAVGGGTADRTVRRWLRQAGAPMRGPSGRPPRPPEPASPSVCAGPDCPGGDLVTASQVAERWAELGRPVTVDAVYWWIQTSRPPTKARHIYPPVCQATAQARTGRRRHWADVLGWGIRSGQLPAWAEQVSVRRWGNANPNTGAGGGR